MELDITQPPWSIRYSWDARYVACMKHLPGSLHRQAGASAAFSALRRHPLRCSAARSWCVPTDGLVCHAA